MFRSWIYFAKVATVFVKNAISCHSGFMTQNSFDVAVIGAGAAGLNAALILGQARRSVIVFDNGSPRNAAADHMNGFLSRDGMNPAELLTIGRGEVRKFGGEFHDGTVVSVTRDGEKFSVELADGSKIQVRKVLVATGLTDRLPDELEVFGERWGRDVLHCPYCHGYSVRDQPLGVIAKSAEFAMHQALMVRQWSDDVVLFLHRITELSSKIGKSLQLAIFRSSRVRSLVPSSRMIGWWACGWPTALWSRVRRSLSVALSRWTPTMRSCAHSARSALRR